MAAYGIMRSVGGLPPYGAVVNSMENSVERFPWRVSERATVFSFSAEKGRSRRSHLCVPVRARARIAAPLRGTDTGGQTRAQVSRCESIERARAYASDDRQNKPGDPEQNEVKRAERCALGGQVLVGRRPDSEHALIVGENGRVVGQALESVVVDLKVEHLWLLQDEQLREKNKGDRKQAQQAANVLRGAQQVRRPSGDQQRTRTALK